MKQWKIPDFKKKKKKQSVTSFFSPLTSKRTASGSACVHKRWGLTRGPQSWPATSGRSSLGSGTVRNRGATPKCHHSCKTAEHKSQITEICTPRPRGCEKKELGDWVAAARWKWSHVVFAGIYPAQEPPDSTAAGRHQWDVLWEFAVDRLAIVLRYWPVNVVLTVSASSLAGLLQ